MTESRQEIAMVQFLECGPAATESDIKELETRLGFAVPSGIRTLLLTANGGRPSPRIFGGIKGTDVSECLALRDGRGSLWWTYELLAKKQKSIPAHFLPFAVDSFGNTFLVDCRTDEAGVYILLHEQPSKTQSLRVNLEEFWASLTDLSKRDSGA